MIQLFEYWVWYFRRRFAMHLHQTWWWIRCQTLMIWSWAPCEEGLKKPLSLHQLIDVRIFSIFYFFSYPNDCWISRNGFPIIFFSYTFFFLCGHLKLNRHLFLMFVFSFLFRKFPFSISWMRWSEILLIAQKKS